MLYGVYGASGFGRELMPVVRQQVSTELEAECVFIDDAETPATVNRYKSMTFESFLSHPAEERRVAIAIAAGDIRAAVAEKCARSNVSVFDVRAQNSIVMDEVRTEEGLVLCSFTTLTANVTIGRHFHANIYSYVGHDCVIGDYVTFAPGVMCNGNVHVEDYAYIGTGAVIRQGIPDKPLVIGAGATVGMGAVVTRDVPPGMTVVGNPAKSIIGDQ